MQLLIGPLKRWRPLPWRASIDPLTPHPRTGAAIGLALVGALVPLLDIWRGADPGGPLGPSIPLLFLAPVLFASTVGGRRAGALVSVVAIAVWDWYFIPPLYTVTIASARDVVALVVFLVVAVLVGQLSNATRRRTEEAMQRARSSEALYDLSVALIARRNLSDVLRALADGLRDTFDLEACAILRPDDATHTWRTAAAAGAVPLDLSVEQSRNVAATVSWVNDTGQASWLGQMAGTGLRDGRLLRPHVRQARAQFVPLRVGARPVGVLELVHRDGTRLKPDREHLLVTFVNGATLALEQSRLAAEEQAAALARESDRLKSVLLSSVSHDLRTPLAGLKVAVGSLLQKDVRWDEEDREAFLRDMDREVDRLTRLVSNLLDLSRIEAGALKADADWEDVTELIDRVVERVEPGLGDHPLLRDGPATLPAARLDAVQIEQVLTNLLENAAKYSPPGTPITLRADVADDPGGSQALRLTVLDRGVGIPRAEQGRIFDKFYRVASTARRAAGTGMGLAIVKGLVEANGGRVTVESAPGEGSAFTISLPLDPPRHGADEAPDETAVVRTAR